MRGQTVEKVYRPQIAVTNVVVMIKGSQPTKWKAVRRMILICTFRKDTLYVGFSHILKAASSFSVY